MLDYITTIVSCNNASFVSFNVTTILSCGEYAVNYANGPVQLESVYEDAYKAALPPTNYKARRIPVGGIYDFHYAKVHLAYYREAYSGPGPYLLR